MCAVLPTEKPLSTNMSMDSLSLPLKYLWPLHFSYYESWSPMPWKFANFPSWIYKSSGSSLYGVLGKLSDDYPRSCSTAQIVAESRMIAKTRAKIRPPFTNGCTMRSRKSDMAYRLKNLRPWRRLCCSGTLISYFHVRHSVIPMC